MTRILYVEDNDDNVYMLKMRFELLNGYEVFTAADGEAGCTMAVTEQPDVILMDLDLPVVDGWEATRRLKQDQATRHVDRYSLNQRYRGRQRVYLQAMRSPHLYTKVACTAKRNFDHECKKTFATKSARSGTHAVQQSVGCGRDASYLAPPRTDPDVQLSRIRLLPWVATAGADALRQSRISKRGLLLRLLSVRSVISPWYGPLYE